MIEVINQNAVHDVQSGEYEKYYQITDRSKILDLGAHVGHFLEYACNKGAWVTALEPHPENFKWLKQRASPFKESATLNNAAWNKNEIRTLYECPTNTGANSLFKHGGCSDIEYEVHCVDIGQLMNLCRFDATFIKIDTEGAEYNILESLFRHGIKTNMAIETHDSKLYDQCRGLAELNGMEWLPKENHVGVCYCFPK